MLVGDKYRHYKGGLYRYDDSALPLHDKNNPVHSKEDLIKFTEVRYHEDSKNMDVYVTKDGKVYIDAEVPHIIYTNENNLDMTWAREEDDFFSTVEYEGETVNRFTRLDTAK